MSKRSPPPIEFPNGVLANDQSVSSKDRGFLQPIKEQDIIRKQDIRQSNSSDKLKGPLHEINEEIERYDNSWTYASKETNTCYSALQFIQKLCRKYRISKYSLDKRKSECGTGSECCELIIFEQE